MLNIVRMKPKELLEKVSTVLVISISISLGSTTPTLTQQNQNNPVQKNNWLVNCSSTTTSEQLQCQMSQSLIDKKTKRKLLSVIVRSNPESGQLNMLLSLPHGLDLRFGAGHQIDDGKVNKVPIQTSDPNGVYAAFPISETFLTSLKAGNRLKISMQTVQQKPVKLDVSLAGFTAAASKLEKLR